MKTIFLGEQGPAQTKELYYVLYDRLVHHHQLNNLLWVWTTAWPRNYSLPWVKSKMKVNR